MGVLAPCKHEKSAKGFGKWLCQPEFKILVLSNLDNGDSKAILPNEFKAMSTKKGKKNKN